MIALAEQKAKGEGDVVLPAGFFFHVMPDLDELALKTYLSLYCLRALGQTELEEEDLASFLGLPPQQLAQVLDVLQSRDLIQVFQEGILIKDLRALLPTWAESDRRTEGTTDPKGLAPKGAREKVIQQINDTFYSGLMPPAFFNAIDRWFEDYAFSPDVVYALFTEMRRYQALHSVNYGDRVAANWASRGIHTFSDLNHYVEERQGLNKAAKKLQGRLRQQEPFTVYQMEYLERWLEEWRLPFDLVDEAFRRASRRRKFDFQYVEGILRSWKEAGLTSLDQVQEQDRQHQEQKREEIRPSRSARGNFRQRSYQEGAFDGLDHSLDFLDREGPLGPAPAVKRG